MRRFVAICLIAVFAASPAPAPAQKREIQTSWGKAGVSFDQYRTNSIECGSQGYYLDISKTEDARAFVRGSRELDQVVTDVAEPGNPYASVWTNLYSLNTANNSQRIVNGVRPEKRMAHLGGIMLEKIEQCLATRGYRKFALTTEQRHRLAHLPIGKPERHAYLYSLASDPAVLQAQAI